MSANPKAEPLLAAMSSTLQKNKRSRLSDYKWVNKVSDETWVAEILQCSDLKGLSKLSRTSTFFNKFWQRVKRACHDHIDVKQNAKNHISFRDSKIYLCCPTIERAMALVQQILKMQSWKKALPLVVTGIKPGQVRIVVGKGFHEIMDNGNTLNVNCSHITFVGKGKDQTTIRGGFYVNNELNVRFEGLTVTNPNKIGLNLRGSETTVDVLKCAVKECGWSGMYVSDGATVAATQCEFVENGGNGVDCYGANAKARLNDCTIHNNKFDGLNAYDDAVVDLRGTKTHIHSNEGDGILADFRGKVNIHLPYKHNISHDNGGQDRYQHSGGSIANINTDGTFNTT